MKSQVRMVLKKSIFLNIITIFIIIQISCNKRTKEVVVLFEELDIIYTRPSILPDSIFGYKSKIYLKLNGYLVNESSEDIPVAFNNLSEEKKYLNILLKMKSKEIHFYNYAFLSNYFPMENSFVLKAKTKKYISLISPIFCDFRELHSHTLDSLYKTFSSFQIHVDNPRYKISNSKVKVYILSKNQSDCPQSRESM